MRVDQNSLPTILSVAINGSNNNQLATSLFACIGIVDGKFQDLHFDKNDSFKKTAVVELGAVYHTPKDLLAFAETNNIFIEKQVAYDVDTGTLINITEAEYNLLTQL